MVPVLRESPWRVPWERRQRAGREAGAQSIDGGQLRSETAFDRAHDVHHVRVALDEHQAVDLDAAELAHAAHIVAAEVDQHHVLGALLLVVHHLIGRAPGLPSLWLRADGFRRWAVLHLALVHAHQQLRRRPRQLKGGTVDSFDFLEESFAALTAHPAAPRERSAGRTCTGWIDGAQGTIDLEAVCLGLDIEALRKNRLEDVAGSDVLLGAHHGRQVVFLAGPVLYFEVSLSALVRCLRRRQFRQRLGEALLQFVEAADAFS